jgi:MFS family permease
MAGHRAFSARRDHTPSRVAVRRLAVGRVISLTGTYAASITLSYSVYEHTRSTLWLTATMLLTFGIVGFFEPFAGTIGDRFDRRRVMILSETGAAGCWILMAFVGDIPSLLLPLAFCASLLEALFVPASGAAIPNVAGEANLAWANSLLAMGRYAGLTLGPLTGGLLFAAMGPRWVFTLNAASFVASAGLVVSVRANFADSQSPLDSEEHSGIGAGVRFIASDRVLSMMLLAWVVFVLGTGTTVIAEPLLADQFGAGSLGYGLITACWGIGTIGGAWMARAVREDREALWLVSFSILMAVTCFGIALSPWFWLVLAFDLAFGVADGPTQVVEQNLLQRRTPDAVRARVMGVWDAAMQVSLVIALVVGGAIVGAAGPKSAYILGGVTGICGAGLMLPLLRRLPSRHRTPEQVVETAIRQEDVA